VVRVWLEGTFTEEETAIWRGSIEQVGSERRMYFSDFDGITRYIRTQIGIEESLSPTSYPLWLEQIKHGIQKLWKRILRPHN
jgi:hypothetical protein